MVKGLGLLCRAVIQTMGVVSNRTVCNTCDLLENSSYKGPSTMYKFKIWIIAIWVKRIMFPNSNICMRPRGDYTWPDDSPTRRKLPRATLVWHHTLPSLHTIPAPRLLITLSLVSHPPPPPGHKTRQSISIKCATTTFKRAKQLIASHAPCPHPLQRKRHSSYYRNTNSLWHKWDPNDLSVTL